MRLFSTSFFSGCPVYDVQNLGSGEGSMIKTAHRLQCLRVVNSPLLKDHFVLNVSQPFLRTGHDYFTEFLAKLDCVTIRQRRDPASGFRASEAQENTCEGAGDSQRGSAITGKPAPRALRNGR